MLVTNSNGCTKLSAGIAVSTPCREGEELISSPIDIGIDVNIFPNPNTGEFTVQFTNQPSEPVKIKITDALGKVVENMETSKETIVINKSNLSEGIYFLSVCNKIQCLLKK